MKSVQAQPLSPQQAPQARLPACRARSPNGDGRPLSPDSRARLEPLFGVDFSRIRIHDDASSHRRARELNASAYTVGQDIHFAAGNYRPASAVGEKLLAHELTHTLQQRGATGREDELEISLPQDSQEREADVVSESIAAGQRAPAIASSSVRRLHRSLGSTLGSVFSAIGRFFAAPFVFLYRAFGGESYDRETLVEYVDGLRGRKSIEANFDSDNKARACVSREQELGAFDVMTRILLVQEMLYGATLWGDEAAIIELLRRATPTDRQQIVTGVGRARILEDFSFRNYRVVEAIMLTAADAAGDSLLNRFRAMGDSDLEDYAANAVDPAVRDVAQKAQALKKITGAVPADAKVDRQGTATFQVNGMDIIASPDVVSTDDSLGERAYTTLGVKYIAATNVMVTTQTGIVQSFDPPGFQLTMQTTYGPRAKPEGASGYGRGTTEQDKATGDTSLKFHENRHTASWIEFLKANGPPVFKGTTGMSRQDFEAEIKKYQTDIEAWHQRAVEYSSRKTDCVGVRVTPEHLKGAGLRATICEEN